jgi:hypothetical protein
MSFVIFFSFYNLYLINAFVTFFVVRLFLMDYLLSCGASPLIALITNFTKHALRENITILLVTRIKKGVLKNL